MHVMILLKCLYHIINVAQRAYTEFIFVENNTNFLYLYSYFRKLLIFEQFMIFF